MDGFSSGKPGIDRRALLWSGASAAALGVIGGGLALPTGALASGATPDAGQPAGLDFIIDCDSWGARQPSSTLVMNTGTTRKIIFHHTAYPNSTDYSLDQAVWLARDIQNLHMDTNGWADTGQHFTVSRGGYVLEGRHRSLEGLTSGAQQVTSAHCPGENTRAIGIENEGTYITETPPAGLLASLVRLSVAICQQYGIHAHNIFGHWDYRDTDCPGILFYRQFPMLRRIIAAQLHTRWADIPARTWPDVKANQTGRVITVAQYLLRAQGYPLTPNSTFDAATVAAVQDWQAKQGLPVSTDGTITEQTWQSLATPLNGQSQGDPVSGLQTILLRKGYPVTVSGGYDQGTRKAVQQMQVLHSLPPTGRVDTDTWCAVVGGVVRAEFTGVCR
jgi:hypothetical protein